MIARCNNGAAPWRSSPVLSLRTIVSSSCVNWRGCMRRRLGNREVHRSFLRSQGRTKGKSKSLCRYPSLHFSRKYISLRWIGQIGGLTLITIHSDCALLLKSLRSAAENTPKQELLEVSGSWISWLHEREWRCKGGYQLPRMPECSSRIQAM